MDEPIRKRRSRCRRGKMVKGPTTTRKATCSLKASYCDFRSARKASKRCSAKVEPYLCDICGKWHLTSTRGK